MGTLSFIDTSNKNAVLTTAPVSSGTQGLNFYNSSTLTVSQQANAVAVADFNNDGIADFAVSDANSGQTLLAVFLGKGDGTLTKVAASPTVGLYPDSIAVADFNADGIPDMAVSSVDDNKVTILLGVGDGTFTTTPQLSTVTTPQSVTSADFNNDGVPDLAVVNAGSILIFLGNGDGTFTQAAASLTTGPSAITVVSGDFNNDGNTDLAFVNSDYNNGSVWIYQGNGDGTFAKVSPSPSAGTEPIGLAVGDFDGDGILDLAVTNYSGDSSNELVILIGRGDGTFKPSTGYSLPGLNFKSVAVADFDGDGIADLAVGEFWGGAFDFLQGKGDGTFATAQQFAANSQLESGYIAAADFNGDGLPDLVLPSQDGNVPVVLSQPNQTVTATVSGVAPIGPGTHQVAASYPGDSNFSASTSSTVALTAALAPPAFSVASGTYTTAQTVTITESIPGSTIYYQVSGDTLNTNGFVPYTGPVALSNGGLEYLSAYATQTGYPQSDTTYATYILNLPSSAPPTFSVAPGYYATQQSVAITAPDPSARIYYTTNGSYPNINSTLYTGPITVSSSETLAAVALSSGHYFSAEVTAQYVIGSSSVPLIYSIAGTGVSGYTGDGGPAGLAQVNYPTAIAKDASGNIYLADSSSHVVRKIAANTGIITTIAGNGTLGNSGDGGPATSAAIGYPVSLVIDGGSLYIGDSNSNLIRKLDLSSGLISTYAGTTSSTSYGDGGPATSAYLNNVASMAVDASHNLYISAVSTVRQVSATTGVITTIAGTGGYRGPSGSSGDGGPASAATFVTIFGMAFDASGNLYLADSQAGFIRKITALNGIIYPISIVSTIAGIPPFPYSPGPGIGDGGPATAASLSSPRNLAFNSSGDLFILDTGHSAVRKIAAATGVITTVAGNDGNYCSPYGDGGAATSASLCIPNAMTVDPAGDIYLADYSLRIREVVAGATPTRQATTPTLSVATGTYANAQSVALSTTTPGASIYFTLDGSTPTTESPGYSLPLNLAGKVTLKAVAVAPGYLPSDPASATYTVSAFSPIITTVAGASTQVYSSVGNSTQLSYFSTLEGLAINKAGDMFLADTVDCVIWKVEATTGIASIYAGNGEQAYKGDGGPATSASLNYPSRLALDSSGNLYIADTSNGVIRKVAADTGTITTYAGVGNYSFSSSIGDGGPATAAVLANPSAIAFDSTGNVYIADEGHSRIRKVDVATGIISTVAGNGTYVRSGDGGLATDAGIVSPTGVAVNAAGDIFISSFNDARIRKVTASTGIIQTIAGFKDISGQSGDGGLATNAQISPYSLALDGTGTLYFSNGPGEIRKIDATTGIISDVAGIGNIGSSGDGGPAINALVGYPYQVAFDSAGDLYFINGLYSVRKVTLTEQTTAAPAFSVQAGSYNATQSVTLTSTTANATIYYTTDGTAPTTSSSVYSTPLSVNTSETIKAFAVALDYNPSPVASAAYVITTSSPTPSLTSLSPGFVTAGAASFTLTVNGAGFTNLSTIVLGSTTLATHFVDSTQLTATVAASSVASAGISSVTVQTPAPGGGTSNALQLEVDTTGGSTPPSFPTPTVSVSVGSTATYPVTLPASATNVSVRCLNLPAGAACSYSSSSGDLTITTTSSTPAGTYLVTAVFTETLPGAALAILFFPLLLTPMAKARLGRRSRAGLLLLTAAVATLGLMAGCSGGGGSSTPPPPATHQVTSSATVTLTIH